VDIIVESQARKVSDDKRQTTGKNVSFKTSFRFVIVKNSKDLNQ